MRISDWSSDVCSSDLFLDLRRRFLDEVVRGTGPDFVEAKLRERDERHRRMGDSSYVLEPNVKDGKGGLRDLQNLYWIAQYLHLVDGVVGSIEPKVLTSRRANPVQQAPGFRETIAEERT